MGGTDSETWDSLGHFVVLVLAVHGDGRSNDGQHDDDSDDDSYDGACGRTLLWTASAWKEDKKDY